MRIVWIWKVQILLFLKLLEVSRFFFSLCNLLSFSHSSRQNMSCGVTWHYYKIQILKYYLFQIQIRYVLSLTSILKEWSLKFCIYFFSQLFFDYILCLCHLLPLTPVEIFCIMRKNIWKCLLFFNIVILCNVFKFI